MPLHAAHVIEGDLLLQADLSGHLVRLPCGVFLLALIQGLAADSLAFFAIFGRAGGVGNRRLSIHKKDGIQSGRRSVSVTRFSYAAAGKKNALRSLTSRT
jgi:hypothetical protein